MKRTAKHSRSDRPVGRLRAVSDILPPPERLVPVDKMVKVTLSLDQRSLAFFKATAAELGGKYQRMMREVLRNYASHYART